MITKICECCGRKYIANCGNQKFCSKSCFRRYSRIKPKGEKKNRHGDTICWDCENTNEGCSWFRDFTPVDGWEAIKTNLQVSDYYGDKGSYIVLKCPNFKKWERGNKKIIDDEPDKLSYGDIDMSSCHRFIKQIGVLGI